MKTTDLHELFLNQEQNFTTDTRKITKEAIFFALKGENFNGNTFAKTALEQGASYVVIDEKDFYIDGRTILVNDVLDALQHLAHFHREYLGIPIIALTGSNGKTTTKEIIREILATQYNVNATKGNLNNHIGVPLTLLSMTAQTEIGVVEMGANHLKEIQQLCFIAAPNFGYITNFGKAHLEGFGSEEGIINGKSEMYDYIANAEQLAFVNQDDNIQMERSEYCECIHINPNENPLVALTPYVQLTHKEQIIQSNLIGKYNYNNIIAAIAIGSYFNISDDNIKKAIEGYIPENNRSQVIQKGSTHIILDAYNANPTSMLAAIENLETLDSKYKTVILGDMFELGATSEKEHKAIVEKTHSCNFNNTIFVGEHFYKQKIDGSIFYRSFEELKNNFKSDLSNNTLLIKGSRGMALERTLDIL